MDIRDRVVDYIENWSRKSGCPKTLFINGLGLGRSRYYDWVKRYGTANCHNGKIPRDFWITEEEKKAVVKYYLDHRSDGYRRVTYMMMDEDIAAMSPASVYRILKNAGVMRSKGAKPGRKGKGFEQPLQVHEHWHTDISHVIIRDKIYHFISVLDGCSRYMLHYELREEMKTHDVQIVLQRAIEKYPGVKPRLISDNGSQYTSKEFKEFIGMHGLTHVRTSPYYPQSNGKQERFHYTIKDEAIRPGTPLTKEDAERLISKYVDYYNNQRLHSAIGYITPADRLKGNHEQIFRTREKKITEARERRKELARKRLAKAS